MSGTADRILKIRDIGVYELAKLADCATPDNATSAGAAFLIHVRDAVASALSEESSDTEYVSTADWQDTQHKIADDAPDVYTDMRWREFIDLCAYHETPGDGDREAWASADLTEIAAEALSQIAYRLAGKLMFCDDTNEAVTECGCGEHAPKCPRCGIREHHVAGGNLCRELGGR